MKKCFILSFNTGVNIKGHGEQLQNFLVLFFPYKNIKSSQNSIQLQLRDHFFRNSLPDKLVIIGFTFNEAELIDLFKHNSTIYDYIPKFQSDANGDNVSVLIINNKGAVNERIGKKPYSNIVSDIYRRGMVHIFRNNGGLIVSQSAHHYVFPSGKHCDRFLRTGNVLINGAEILFIASAIILHFKGKQFLNIYCDTSSINSLAYSYISLLRDLNKSITSTVHVESFGSYELFEKFKFKAERDSLFLISSSTSGSILKRMTSRENKGQNIDLKNIAVIYGLNVEHEYNFRIICDLTYDLKANPMGLPPFESFNVNKGEKCMLCARGSMSVKVEGDVFLLEKPVVIGHRVTIFDAPSFLTNFGDFYKNEVNDKPVIRTFYKENSTGDKKYDVYIDVEYIFDRWLDGSYEDTRGVYDKLEKYIYQHIPATLKYMVVLPDTASKKLAKIISEILKKNGIKFEEKNILKIENLIEIDKNGTGVIAVVSSSIVSGRNLLYLSRALREYEQTYQRMFFTFLQRAERKDHCEFLESNLGMGEFGKGSNKIVNVETIYCSQESLETPWHIELEFLKKLQEFCDENSGYGETNDFCVKRIQVLNESGLNRGLVDNLFFPNLSGENLRINNGFAFAPSDNKNFAITSTQSEVYFIISSVLNEIRFKGKLQQSEYVRNLVEPGNFVRYNDGIIQACLLRATKPSELQYNLSQEMSLQMQAILGDMIMHMEDNHAEAINEFLYAIAIQKLKLTTSVLADVISLLDTRTSSCQESILHGLIAYIKMHVLVKRQLPTVFSELATKLEEMQK